MYVKIISLEHLGIQASGYQLSPKDQIQGLE